ncbi:hypothetical protein DB30_04540 [Enhygromyxa salina]|uniref:Uncharacterized protein n=1 Tax=Enhygromyxa salina TaxID=215803 RepID=A0A0C1ZYQ5_9BACT|nr:hypothetical protein [Enhygromyxa salina]KIG16373.1 hypothetical protein DB30_04540 [Enhygromyxa salina]
MTTSNQDTQATSGKRAHELDLASMYLSSAVAGAHSIGVQLTAEREGHREGALSLDPNHCGLNPWGDRTWCSQLAVRALQVTATRMRTLDPSGHGRVHYRLTSEEFVYESFNLIEHPRASLWYLVYTREPGGAWVVPLFEGKLLEVDTTPLALP